MEKAFLIGLIPILSWGASDYLVGKSSRQFTPLTALFSINVVGVMVAALLMIPFPGGGLSSHLSEVFVVAAISTLMTIAYLALTTALDIGPISVASATANGYPLVITLLVVAFGASLVVNVAVGALVVFVGGALLSAEDGNQGVTFFASKAFRIATISVLAWGVAFFLLGRVSENLNWAEVNTIVGLTMMSQCALVMFLRKISIRKTLVKLSERTSWPMWLAGALQSIGLAALFLAQDVGGSVVVPAVMASASPLVTAGLAAYFDKEKLLKINYIGAIVIVVGIMLINSVEL